MPLSEDLFKILLNYHKQNSSDYFLYLDDESFTIKDVSISYSPTPVNEPTTRGGVYFSEKFAYKMTGKIEDLSVIPLLTKNMLGPNTEFGELKITTTLNFNGKTMNFHIYTNLTNSVQSPTFIELSMIIVKLDSV